MELIWNLSTYLVTLFELILTRSLHTSRDESDGIMVLSLE